MKDEAISVLKRDPMNLMKLRHPSILNLIEQPAEDEKFVVFITEPIRYSLACLADNSKEHLREKIPSNLEVKQLVLELFEAINFIHQNAKLVHTGISPENLYVTSTGKLKIAGFSFSTQMTTEESMSAPLYPNTRFNEFNLLPNLKFSAPEISGSQARCSTYSDLFSIGCVIYFLLSLDQRKDPFILGQPDQTSEHQHKSEMYGFQSRLMSKLRGMDDDIV